MLFCVFCCCLFYLLLWRKMINKTLVSLLYKVPPLWHPIPIFCISKVHLTHLTSHTRRTQYTHQFIHITYYATEDHDTSREGHCTDLRSPTDVSPPICRTSRAGNTAPHTSSNTSTATLLSEGRAELQTLSLSGWLLGCSRPRIPRTINIFNELRCWRRRK